MNLDTITMPPDEATEKLETYREALRHHDDPVYEDIARGLRWLRRDDVLGLLDLRAAITAGGVDGRGRPRLAVMQADEPWVWLNLSCDGSVTFQPAKFPAHNRRRGMFEFPAGTLPVHEEEWINFKGGGGYYRCALRCSGWVRAMVPTVPPHLRPRTHLRNYAVLWEVDRWQRDPEPPRDPALLKHVGGDLYALLGVWDLTDLERAVLSGHRRGTT